jgi:hypothetical protein
MHPRIGSEKFSKRVKSFQFSLLFFHADEIGADERSVLVIGNALLTKKLVVDENQIETADDKRNDAKV